MNKARYGNDGHEYIDKPNHIVRLCMSVLWIKSGPYYIIVKPTLILHSIIHILALSDDIHTS